MNTSLDRRAVAEFLGTAFLVAAVVGSGIMGERLSGGNTAIALLANTVATGAALVALIIAFAPVSGAHLNPVVTVTELLRGQLGWSEASAYIAAQLLGGIAGAAVANLMFGLHVISISRHARSGHAQFLSEFVATFGLIAIIRGASRFRTLAVAFAVGAYITAAYWFTSSMSFANPAVTIARCLSDTFAGIRPADVPGFVVAQFIGGFAAALLFGWLAPRLEDGAEEVLVSRDTESSGNPAPTAPTAGFRLPG